jgi:hypothetical protein
MDHNAGPASLGVMFGTFFIGLLFKNLQGISWTVTIISGGLAGIWYLIKMYDRFFNNKKSE